MGCKSSPSASVCSQSLDAVPINSLVYQVFFKCRPPSLCWTALLSATTTKGPWHFVIGWSFSGILMIWSAIRSHLPAIMSCNLHCPVLHCILRFYVELVTGIFVPTYFRSQEQKFHSWNFRSLVLSFPGTLVPWNFCSPERKWRGTFAPHSELTL